MRGQPARATFSSLGVSLAPSVSYSAAFGRVAAVHLRRYSPRHAKVGNFHHALGGHEQVCGCAKGECKGRWVNEAKDKGEHTFVANRGQGRVRLMSRCKMQLSWRYLSPVKSCCAIHFRSGSFGNGEKREVSRAGEAGEAVGVDAVATGGGSAGRAVPRADA